MNFIFRISPIQSQLKLENRQPYIVNNSNLTFYYNANNNLVQLEVLRTFTQALLEGLTVNNILINSQATFDAAMLFLFSTNDIIPTYASNTAAITAGLTTGQKYFLPITNDNYILCYVINNTIPVITTGNAILSEAGTTILNEDGTTPILNEN